MAAIDHAPHHRKPAVNGEPPADTAYDLPHDDSASSHTTPPPPPQKKGGGAAPAAAPAGVKPKKPLDPSEVRLRHRNCACGGGNRKRASLELR